MTPLPTSGETSSAWGASVVIERVDIAHGGRRFVSGNGVS